MEVSPVWLPKQDMKKDDPNRHANMIRELAGPHPSTKSYQQLMSAENERNFFPRGGDTDTSLGNVFIQVILWTTQGICVNIYVCIQKYMCVCENIYEKDFINLREGKGKLVVSLEGKRK